jgi:hypothetical protein
MEKALAVLNNKKMLYGLIPIAVIYEMLYGFGLGGMLIDFTLWYVGIGYALIPITQSIINIINPDNTIKIEPLTRINLSIILGIFAGVLFGGFLNLGLILIGADSSS